MTTSEVQLRIFSVYIPNLNGDGVYKIIGINVPVRIDPDSGEEILTPEAHDLINKTKFHHRFTANPNEPMNQTKRIVIIEGDAFDADAIVAITKSLANPDVFNLHVAGMDSQVYNFSSRASRIESMHAAIDAWRSKVGDLEIVDATTPLPEEEVEDFTLHWRDEKGRYYETYGGSRIFTGTKTGRFVWNEGPPRRKNPLGEGASPILRVYVDEAGKPIEPQPI